MTKKQRLVRALREPRRFVTGLLWQVRIPRARLALKYGRPIPEALREVYFFRLHHFAERAYEPKPYPGEMLVFTGTGLYEDPELGWGGLRPGGRSSPTGSRASTTTTARPCRSPGWASSATGSRTISPRPTWSRRQALDDRIAAELLARWAAAA